MYYQHETYWYLSVITTLQTCNFSVNSLLNSACYCNYHRLTLPSIIFRKYCKPQDKIIQ